MTTRFQENQRPREPWLLILHGFSVLLLLVAGIVALVSPGPTWVRLVVAAVAWLVMVLVASTHLLVRVEEDVLRIRYWPFARKEYPLRGAGPAETRVYRPIRDFGGWGIRRGRGRVWAWTMDGKTGVQVELVDGRRVLVGTRRPEELRSAIESARQS